MGESDSFFRLVLLLGVMALLAVVEVWVPLREATQPRGPRLRTNLALLVIFLTLNLLLTAAVLGTALALEARGFGLLHALALPAPISFALSFVLLDFFAYAVHVLMHKVPLLWRLHRVHHSDVHVDVTTAFRQHPMEGLLRFAFTCGPAILLGASAGAVAAYRLVSGLNAALEHANIGLPSWLDRPLRWLVVTPDMHKIHHSRRAVETDSNYANIFSLNDRVFGTYTAAAPDLRYGLDEVAGDARLRELLRISAAPVRSGP
jgi:sterol desaturase/sphingolipid hydroxylase (fatty acid hydroxylase superfamily)